MEIATKSRVLGEAASFVLIAPVLLFIVFFVVMKIVPPHIHIFFGFTLSTLCGVAQVIALKKLEVCKSWKFGWAKLGNFTLSVVSFILLLQFLMIALLLGYYILHPNAPMLFGGA